MDALDFLTLKAFILTLSQLPTIPPGLQTALQNLPPDPKGMLIAIEDLIDQEPLAKLYLKYQALLQAREGKRNKADEMLLPDDDEPNDEIGNTLVAIENKSSKEIIEKLPEIAQSPDIQQAIISYLGL